MHGGISRLTYALGWVFLAVAIIARILTYTAVLEHMRAAAVLPRNFFELSILFFVASIAASVMPGEKS